MLHNAMRAGVAAQRGKYSSRPNARSSLYRSSQNAGRGVGSTSNLSSSMLHNSSAMFSSRDSVSQSADAQDSRDRHRRWMTEHDIPPQLYVQSKVAYLDKLSKKAAELKLARSSNPAVHAAHQGMDVDDTGQDISRYRPAPPCCSCTPQLVWLVSITAYLHGRFAWARYPFSAFRLMCDLLVGMLVIWTMIWVPFSVGFDIDVSTGQVGDNGETIDGADFLRGLEQLTDIVFAIDLLVAAVTWRKVEAESEAAAGAGTQPAITTLLRESGMFGSVQPAPGTRLPSMRGIAERAYVMEQLESSPYADRRAPEKLLSLSDSAPGAPAEFAPELAAAAAAAGPPELYDINWLTNARGYLTSRSFLIDFVSTLPIDLIVSAALGVSSRADARLAKVARIVRIVRLTKLLRLLRISRLKRFQEIVARNALTVNFSLIKLLRQLGSFLVLSHIFACLWHYLSFAPWMSDTIAQGASWLHNSRLDNAALMDRWVASMYYVASVMLSVGYGAIHPFNHTERVVSMLLMLVGAGLYGTMIANLTSIVSAVNARSIVVEQRMNEVKSWMIDRELPADLQVRIRRYFSYFLQRRSVVNETELLDTLSSSLRNEVVAYTNSRTILQLHAFKAADATLITALITKFKPLFALPKDTLAREGEMGMEFFFLVRGAVEITTIDPGTEFLLHQECTYVLRKHTLSLARKSRRGLASKDQAAAAAAGASKAPKQATATPSDHAAALQIVTAMVANTAEDEARRQAVQHRLQQRTESSPVAHQRELLRAKSRNAAQLLAMLGDDGVGVDGDASSEDGETDGTGSRAAPVDATHMDDTDSGIQCVASCGSEDSSASRGGSSSVGTAGTDRGYRLDDESTVAPEAGHAHNMEMYGSLFARPYVAPQAPLDTVGYGNIMAATIAMQGVQSQAAAAGAAAGAQASGWHMAADASMGNPALSPGALDRMKQPPPLAVVAEEEEEEEDQSGSMPHLGPAGRASSQAPQVQVVASGPGFGQRGTGGSPSSHGVGFPPALPRTGSMRGMKRVSSAHSHQDPLRAAASGTSATVVRQGTQYVLGVVTDGRHCGDVSVLLDVPRPATLRASSVCDIQVITKTELLDVLADFTEKAEELRYQAEGRQKMYRRRKLDVARLLHTDLTRAIHQHAKARLEELSPKLPRAGELAQYVREQVGSAFGLASPSRVQAADAVPTGFAASVRADTEAAYMPVQRARSAEPAAAVAAGLLTPIEEGAGNSSASPRSSSVPPSPSHAASDLNALTSSNAMPQSGASGSASPMSTGRSAAGTEPTPAGSPTSPVQAKPSPGSAGQPVPLPATDVSSAVLQGKPLLQAPAPSTPLASAGSLAQRRQADPGGHVDARAVGTVGAAGSTTTRPLESHASRKSTRLQRALVSTRGIIARAKTGLKKLSGTNKEVNPFQAGMLTSTGLRVWPTVHLGNDVLLNDQITPAHVLPTGLLTSDMEDDGNSLLRTLRQVQVTERILEEEHRARLCLPARARVRNFFGCYLRCQRASAQFDVSTRLAAIRGRATAQSICIRRVTHCLCPLRLSMQLFSDQPEVEDVEHADALGARGVIMPEGRVKGAWDSMMLCLILFTMLQVPMSIAYGVAGTATGIFAVLERVVDVAFGCDMLVSTRTAYIDPSSDLLVTVPRRILSNYIHKQLGLDFISTFPFDLALAQLISGGSGLRTLKLIRMVRLTRLLKLFRLAKLNKYMSKVSDRMFISPVVLKISSLLLRTVFIGHLIACLFFFVGSVSSGSSGATGDQVLLFNTSHTSYSWFEWELKRPDPVAVYGIEEGGWDPVHQVHTIEPADVPLWQQYIASLYYAITTVTTVGLGDVVPQNTPERLFAVAAMMFGATLFGYIIGSVASLIGQARTSNARIQERMEDVTQYAREKRLPTPLWRRMQGYVERLVARKSAFDEESILSELSDTLRREVVLFLNADVISKVPFFSGADEGLVFHIVSLLEPLFADAGDYVYRVAEVARHMYVLTEGQVKLVRPAHAGAGVPALELGRLEAGAFFGEQELLTGIRRSHHAVATRSCSLLLLSLDDLIVLVDAYPDLGIALEQAMRDTVHALAHAKRTAGQQ